MIKKFNFLNIAIDEQDIDLYIDGDIVNDEDTAMWLDVWGIKSTSADSFKQMLADNAGKNLNIHISSAGGDLLAGIAMYNAIMDFKGNTTCIVDGLVASAATLPMCACNTVKAKASSVIMVHEASMGTNGNIEELKADIETLKVMNNAISNAYEIKTGMSREEILKLMNKETWMDVKEAKRLGFVDIIDDKLSISDEVITNLINAQKAIYASATNKPSTKHSIPVRVTQPNEFTVNNATSFEFIKAKLQLQGEYNE